MARVLQIKRGKKANMPTLAEGEFGFAMDSGAEELHIGTGGSNIQLARQDDVKAAYELANTAQTNAATAQSIANSKAPAYSYGTTDLTAGTSELETGKLHFVYE